MEEVKPPKKNFIKLLVIAFFVVLIGISVTISYYIWNKKTNEFKTVLNPQKAKEIALTLKETVSKIYILPPEDPVVATVTDKKDLPEGSFYQSAENGDKILVFEVSRKVILYRPSINKVVDVGFLEAPPAPPALEVAGAQTPESSDQAAFKTTPKVLFKAINQE